jgi:hypothetical protein
MSKKLFSLSALFFAAFVMFTATSCGDDCKFEQKDFVGSYLATEDCSASQATSYNVTITAGASETDVKVTNVWGLFANAVNATIDCETITISRQEPDNDGYFVEGSGIIEKNDGNITVNMTYTVTDENDPTNILTDNCTSTVYAKL